MKKICSIIALLALLLLSGCRAVKPDPVIVTRTDSISTEYIETVRIDTVPVIIAVPVESSRQVVPDSTSHLETSIAVSDAWINPDGTLGHSIKNKDSPIKAEVAVPVKDTQKSSRHVWEVPVPYPVKEPVYVVKPPSAWQQFKINSFWLLTIGLSVSLLYIFRKPLLQLLCRLRL